MLYNKNFVTLYSLNVQGEDNIVIEFSLPIEREECKKRQLICRQSILEV